MSNMTVTQRTQFDRVDLARADHRDPGPQRARVIAYTVLAACVLGALGYATVGRDRRLGAGDRPRRDHADRRRRDDRGQPAPRANRRSPLEIGRTTRDPAKAGPSDRHLAARR